ncbi:hypothetical protein NDU88_000962 [Pleurodeles waltl]|uniref:Metalloproteinase inhibitor 1 n=1 Tax=Pleurodeles waltl TaxID=8319 RepID=A0AAV7M6T4_PLEWA|nr:hypothetical protein NDU88_000962 [Pleurodeles waltl]
MDRRKCILLVAGLLLLEISSPVEACICLPSVLQNSYCNSGVAVLKGKFLEPSQKPGESPTDVVKGYKVHILEVLRGDDALKSVTFIDSMKGTSCEYHHSPKGFNVDYLIIADNNNGDLTVSSCSYIEIWSGLSPKRILGVKGAYSEGCECKVVPCSSQPCSSEPRTCTLEQYEGGDGENQRKNQVCVPSKGPRCIWKTIE